MERRKCQRSGWCPHTFNLPFPPQEVVPKHGLADTPKGLVSVPMWFWVEQISLQISAFCMVFLPRFLSPSTRPWPKAWPRFKLCPSITVQLLSFGLEIKSIAGLSPAFWHSTASCSLNTRPRDEWQKQGGHPSYAHPAQGLGDGAVHSSLLSCSAHYQGRKCQRLQILVIHTHTF